MAEYLGSRKPKPGDTCFGGGVGVLIPMSRLYGTERKPAPPATGETEPQTEKGGPLKRRSLPPDDPIYSRGYVIGTTVAPRQPRIAPAEERTDD